jgi:hypothetical protein
MTHSLPFVVLSLAGAIVAAAPSISVAATPPRVPVAKATAPAGLKTHGSTPVIPIRIVSPVSGTKWQVAKSYFIRWTADTKPDDAFTVELCTTAGTRVWMIQEGEGAQRQADGSWFVPVNLPCGHPVCAGAYKVRVTSVYLKKSALGGTFTIEKQTRKIIENVPVAVQNAAIIFSNYTGDFLPQDCETPNQGTRARVGRGGHKTDGNYGWQLLRSRLTFDLSEYKNKNWTVEDAKLLLADRKTCPGAEASFCTHWLFALKPEEVNTWNRSKSASNAAIGELFPLTGWSSPVTIGGSVNITTPVRDWVKGTKPNLGFAATGQNLTGCQGSGEHQSCSYSCIDYLHPIMYVTFIEEVCPCEN